MMSAKNLTLLAGLAVVSLTGVASAATIGDQLGTTGNPFTFTNGTGLNVPGGLVTRFEFNPDATGLGLTDAATFNPYNAILTVRTTSGGAAVGPTGANNYDQPLVAGAPYAFEYRSTTAIGSKPAGSLLLGITMSTFQFSAAAGTVAVPGKSAAINESNGVGGSLVVYTSDFIPNLSTFIDGAVGYSFTDGSGANQLGAGGQLSTNNYDGNGIFSVVRGGVATPEPGSVAMLVAGGITGAGLFLRRRRK